MGNYSIKELEKLSGVKAHTIRIWEQRYELLNPRRTDTNIRYYSDYDVKKLLKVSVLIQAGKKVSKLAALEDDELNIALDEVQEVRKNTEVAYDIIVSNLLSHGLTFDEYQFKKEFNKSLEAYGTTTVFRKIVYPLLHRIGLMWGRDLLFPAQEHFISNMVRNKLCAAIEDMKLANEEEFVVLFLPEDETHEIGLLFTNYLLRKWKIGTIYLGQNVPVDNVIKVAKDKNCKRLIGFITMNAGMKVMQERVDRLHEELPTSSVYWAGNTDLIKLLQLPSNHFVLTSMDDLSAKILLS